MGNNFELAGCKASCKDQGTREFCCGFSLQENDTIVPFLSVIDV